MVSYRVKFIITWNVRCSHVHHYNHLWFSVYSLKLFSPKFLRNRIHMLLKNALPGQLISVFASSITSNLYSNWSFTALNIGEEVQQFLLDCRSVSFLLEGIYGSKLKKNLFFFLFHQKTIIRLERVKVLHSIGLPLMSFGI